MTTEANDAAGPVGVPLDVGVRPLPEVDKTQAIGYDAIRYVSGYPESYVKRYAAEYAAQDRLRWHAKGKKHARLEIAAVAVALYFAIALYGRYFVA